MQDERTIRKVKDYWNSNPVHSVEFHVESDLSAYLNEIDELRWSDNERWSRSLFYEFDSGPGIKLLDAGCGIGVLSRFYARKQFEVYSVDISDKAVEITDRSLKLFGLKGQVSVSSVEDLPFPDNSFEYIVSNGVIHHTPETEKAVAEFYRVLKPGGCASVCVYYKNILLRRPIWWAVSLALRFLLLKRRGREKLLTATTPEELVRAYDGNDTPIAKLYTRAQADKLFTGFRHLAVEPHYFPIRFLKICKTGSLVHKLLDRYCGVLLYYLLEKPQ